jgi:hypothetical protein
VACARSIAYCPSQVPSREIKEKEATLCSPQPIPALRDQLKRIAGIFTHYVLRSDKTLDRAFGPGWSRILVKPPTYINNFCNARFNSVFRATSLAYLASTPPRRTTRSLHYFQEDPGLRPTSLSPSPVDNTDLQLQLFFLSIWVVWSGLIRAQASFLKTFICLLLLHLYPPPISIAVGPGLFILHQTGQPLSHARCHS